MIDYGDVTVARRSLRLVREASWYPDTSILNVMFIIGLIALVVAGIGSVFK